MHPLFLFISSHTLPHIFSHGTVGSFLTCGFHVKKTLLWLGSKLEKEQNIEHKNNNDADQRHLISIIHFY